jgi:hypothetical protein
MSFGDQDREEDDLNNAAKGGLDHDSCHFWHFSSELLSGEANAVHGQQLVRLSRERVSELARHAGILPTCIPPFGLLTDLLPAPCRRKL